MRETEAQAIKSSTNVDSDSPKKIPRARARETTPEIPHAQRDSISWVQISQKTANREG
jgi:hypothetical protein